MGSLNSRERARRCLIDGSANESTLVVVRRLQHCEPLTIGEKDGARKGVSDDPLPYSRNHLHYATKEDVHGPRKCESSFVSV